MDDDFYEQWAIRVRDLSKQSRPFHQEAIADLASRYEAGLPIKTGPLPLPTINEIFDKRRD